jgi:hypothetical protein
MRDPNAIVPEAVRQAMRRGIFCVRSVGGELMCGRYARRSDKQKIAELFAIHGPVLPDFGPSGSVDTSRPTTDSSRVAQRWPVHEASQARAARMARTRAHQYGLLHQLKGNNRPLAVCWPLNDPLRHSRHFR